MGFIIVAAVLLMAAYFVHVVISSDEKPCVNYANLKYFGVTDRDNYFNVWPKGRGVGDCIEFHIAGVIYRDNIKNYLGEFEGQLVAEPDNPHDPNAIKVLAHDGHHVGYVPKDMTAEVHKYITLPCKCYCFIAENRNGEGAKYHTDCYVNFHY